MNTFRPESNRHICIRALPWGEEPGVEVTQYAVSYPIAGIPRIRGAIVRKGTSPRTFGAPDPLWDEGRLVEDVRLRPFASYLLPCLREGMDDVQAVWLPRRVYGEILQKLLGVPAVPTWDLDEDESDTIERLQLLREAHPKLLLEDALAKLETESASQAEMEETEEQWAVEPLDVCDPENGCWIQVGKWGQRIDTRFTVDFLQPSAIQLPEIPFSTPLEVLTAAEVLPFDFALYVEACNRADVSFASEDDVEMLRSLDGKRTL